MDNLYDSNFKLYIESIVQTLSAGNSVKITCLGSSMLPTISNNEKKLIVPIKENIKIGDIVFVFINSDFFYLHRVTKIYKKFFITKGDNSEVEDPPVTNEEILGICIE